MKKHQIPTILLNEGIIDADDCTPNRDEEIQKNVIPTVLEHELNTIPQYQYPEKDDNLQKNIIPTVFEDQSLLKEAHFLQKPNKRIGKDKLPIIMEHESPEDEHYRQDKDLERNYISKTWVQKLFNFVHLDMIPTKVMYFFWGGLIGTFYVYLYPFFVSVGISESKAGIITGISFAVTSLTGPLWGILTDYSGHRKIILTIICGCAAVWIGSLPLIGSALSGDQSKVSCVESFNSSVNTTVQDSNISYYNCSLNTNTSTNTDHNSSTVGDSLFYIFLVIMAVGAAFFGNLQGYMEAIALNAIKVSRNGASYGGQRLFGSLGIVATTCMTGALVDNFQFKGMSAYSIAFFVYVPFPIILIPLGYYIIHQHVTNSQQNYSDKIVDNNKEESTDRQKNNITKELCSMFSRFEVILFMSTALVAGLAFNQFIYFTMLLLQERMDISFTKASFVMSGFSIASIVMFPLTGFFIRVMRGPVPAIVLGMFSHCIRHIVMAYTSSYNVMLGIQVLHCFNFALLWSAMMEYVHAISPPSIRVTMNVILQSVHFGLGTFLVNMVGGVLCQQYGAQLLFLGNGLLCGAWATLLVLYHGMNSILKRQEQMLMEGSKCTDNVGTGLLVS